LQAIFACSRLILSCSLHNKSTECPDCLPLLAATQLGFTDAWVHLLGAGNIVRAQERTPEGRARLYQALQVSGG
jgi:hypothetical protein